jgi:hypothetical protein
VILTLTILLACCILAYFAVVKSRSAGTGFVSGAQLVQQRRHPVNADNKPAVARHDYRAVSIVPGSCACAAALNLKGKRSLPEQLPGLPLPGCNAETCGCKFKHYADRRDRDDRRSVYTGMQSTQRAATGERRNDARRHDAVQTDLDMFNISYD